MHRSVLRFKMTGVSAAPRSAQRQHPGFCPANVKANSLGGRYEPFEGLSLTSSDRRPARAVSSSLVFP
jgi:hypothetical protein